MLSVIKSLDYFSFGNPNLIYFILHVTMVNVIFTGPWRACRWVRDSIKQGEYLHCKDNPHSVLTGVHKSFWGDFTLFLRSHTQEMVSSGHMVLTIIGSDRKADSSGNQSCTIWELLRITLNDMVQEIQNPLCLLFPPAETHGMYHLSLFYHPAPRGSRWPDVCDYANHIKYFVSNLYATVTVIFGPKIFQK